VVVLARLYTRRWHSESANFQSLTAKRSRKRSVEEEGFELAVPPRREMLWAATPGKHCGFGPEPVSGSALRAIAMDNWTCSVPRQWTTARGRGLLRAITPVVIPDTLSVFRKPEHRELLLSGLRLAIGETT
jgi:hypothetical protein